MPNNIIQVQYENVDQIIRRFEAAGDEVQRMHQVIRRQGENLCASGWIGAGSEQFQQEMTELVLPALMRLSQALTASAETAQEVARIFAQAEEEAAALFQKDGAESSSPPSGIAAPGVGEFIRDAFILFNPYTISEALPGLQNAPAGQDVLQQATDHKITFEIEGSGERLGYQGDDGTVIKIKMGESVGGGHFSSDKAEIVVSNDMIGRARTKADLAGLLAHEMQHAVDAHIYPAQTQGPLSDEEWSNYFKLPPERQAEAKRFFEQEVTRMVDTEVRAYERSDAMAGNHVYQDDGVMTQAERQAILNKQLNFSQDYEAYYESSLSGDGKEFDVWLDSSGSVHVDIQKPREKPDSWWPY